MIKGILIKTVLPSARTVPVVKIHSITKPLFTQQYTEDRDINIDHLAISAKKAVIYFYKSTENFLHIVIQMDLFLYHQDMIPM